MQILVVTFKPHFHNRLQKGVPFQFLGKDTGEYTEGEERSFILQICRNVLVMLQSILQAVQARRYRYGLGSICNGVSCDNTVCPNHRPVKASVAHFPVAVAYLKIRDRIQGGWLV